MRILLADEDAGSRGTLERTLSDWGHEVVLAEDCHQAWTRFQESGARLALVSWTLAGGGGAEFCARIRAHVSGEFVYILLLAGGIEQSELVKSLDLGADDFIEKPVIPDILFARLRNAMRIVNLELKLESRLNELARSNRQMRKDLEAASMIQVALLPDNHAEFPNLNYKWSYKPCQHVGGDILNIFRLDEDSIGAYVLDVSGHGVPAAMLAVTLSQILSPRPERSGLLKQASPNPPYYRIRPPVEVADSLNKRFPFQMEALQYFTILYGVLHTREMTFRYVQCGHPGAIVHHPGRAPEYLGIGDLAIGIDPDAEFHEKSVRLTPGSRLYLYSDGLFEAEDPQERQYGLPRVQEHLGQNAMLPLEGAIDSLQADILHYCRSGRFEDDMTILGIEIQPADSPE